MKKIPAVLLLTAALLCACEEGAEKSGLPMELPFSLERDEVGTPLSEAEISAFTKRITGFWKEVDYFTWVYETSHGMDASTGYPDYLIWWHDVDAVKAGDTVTFRNNSAYGGSHNNAEPTSLVLIVAIGGYLSSGDPAMRMVVEQFVKSYTAVMLGFVYDENDPLPHIMARNIVAHNHAFILPSGKSKAVDYEDWYSTYEGWNANRYHYPDNPTWGDIYVTSMRSKDDVPFMYRAAAWFPYLLEFAEDQSVREAAEEALALMQAFAKDIVDQGYQIRSKDADGNPYVPDEDLATFVGYTSLFPDAECDPRLGSAILGYGEPLDVDCGSGQGSDYDRIAGSGHYFNYSIIDNFHMSAVLLALTHGHDRVAEKLLRGWITRIERYRDPQGGEPGWDEADWERDISLYLLQGAAIGMPLTSEEAREIHKFLDRAVEIYSEFPNWDLWDPAVPDGAYDFRRGFQPERNPESTRVEELTMLLEYCWSPFKNPTGVEFVDCDMVRDPSRWGQ